MTRLYHLVPEALWGPAYEPASVRDEGFVHFSFAEQVEGSAARHFASASRLLLLTLDGDRVPVVVEDSYGTGTAFPHGYGSFPHDAVLAVHELTRDDGGRWRVTSDD